MNEKSYCSAINKGLHINNKGQIKFCCSGIYDLGSLQTVDFNTFYESEVVKNIEKSILKNETHRYCEHCDKVWSKSPSSAQRWMFQQDFSDDGIRKLEFLDIRWNNYCNLSCRYCNKNDSSVWQQIIEKNKKIIIDQSHDYKLLEEIKRNKNTIKTVLILGGEPLLQKQNEKVIEILPESTNISIFTNLSVKLENNRIYNALISRKNTDLNISFENIGDRFEYVRAGASWDVFNKNLDRVLNDFGNNKIGAQSVYTVWSALNLKEFYEFVDGRFGIQWQIGNNGPFEIFGHKPSIIKKAIEEIEFIQSKYDHYPNNGIVQLESIKNSLINDISHSHKNKKLLNWISKHENLIPSNKKFTELWPELYQLLLEK